MKVLIADDHAIVRKGLRLILKESGKPFEIGEASDGEELLALARRERWDVVILDISFPGRSGLDVLPDLRGIRPDVPVLILSMHAEEEYAVRAFRTGASGYLMKESASDELLAAIEKIAHGGRYLTPAVAEALAAEIAGDAFRPPHRLLSNRELEVLRFTARGRTPTEIAALLGLSIKTVSTYRSRIIEKLGVENVAGIIRYAIDHRLV